MHRIHCVQSLVCFFVFPIYNSLNLWLLTSAWMNFLSSWTTTSTTSICAFWGSSFVSVKFLSRLVRNTATPIPCYAQLCYATAMHWKLDLQTWTTVILAAVTSQNQVCFHVICIQLVYVQVYKIIYIYIYILITVYCMYNS